MCLHNSEVKLASEVWLAFKIPQGGEGRVRTNTEIIMTPHLDHHLSPPDISSTTRCTADLLPVFKPIFA